MRGEIEARDPGGLARCTDIATRYIEDRWGSGPVAAPMRAHMVVARA